MKNHIKLSDESVSDTVEFTILQNGKCCIEISSPWAGDSENGFGQDLSIILDDDQFNKLKLFFNQI